MLDFLAARLPRVSRVDWQRRMASGEVVDERGDAVVPDRRFEPGLRLFYYRTLDSEPQPPGVESVGRWEPVSAWEWARRSHGASA